MAAIHTAVSVRLVPAAATSSDRLPMQVIVAYGLPILGVGVMWNMLSFYFLKFATDQLLIAPALMGVIFGASRIWDAISDPLAGYLSDRTVTRLGRRRPWILASAFPLALCFFAVWAPPATLGETGQLVWVSVALFLFFTAITAFRIPHASLGAELSSGYHERTRVFTSAGLHEGLGGLLGVGLLFVLLSSATEPRVGLAWIAAAVSTLSLVLMLLAVCLLREPRENLTRGASHPWSALRDVWANPHARRLQAAKFCQTLGLGCTVTIVPYVADYVYGDERYLALFLVSFIVPAMTLMPLSARLSRRYGKRNVYVVARAIEALMFGLLFLGPALLLPVTLFIVALAGSVDGIASVLSSSLSADIVDYDECRTGQRKEGAYFSFWSLGEKLAIGAAVPIVGVALGLSGFQAGAEQTESVLLTMRGLLGLAPLTLLMLGVMFMLRFRLNEREHTEMRASMRSPESST